ncbi:MAG TPA: hypothetical protein VFR24_03580 [Candidatus Angelobacter sp.]|nr:hypothetical protein [Candidatus Angelobacter sp.]
MLYRSIKPLIVDAIQVAEAKDIVTEGGLLHVNAGDWLIRDPQGNLVRCDDLNFKSMYETFSHPAKLEQFRESKPCGC